jgi:hypothetical protein
MVLNIYRYTFSITREQDMTLYFYSYPTKEDFEAYKAYLLKEGRMDSSYLNALKGHNFDNANIFYGLSQEQTCYWRSGSGKT